MQLHMPNSRIRQKLVLLALAIATAATLGLLAHAADLSGTTTSVIGGLALGLLVAFGAPYAFDMHPTAMHDRNYLPVLKAWDKTMTSHATAQHMASDDVDVGSNQELMAKLMCSELMRSGHMHPHPKSSMRFTIVVDESSSNGPVIRVSVTPWYGEHRRHERLSLPAKEQSANSSEIGRFVVPEAKQRPRHPQPALHLPQTI